jgi:hypothetical protein
MLSNLRRTSLEFRLMQVFNTLPPEAQQMFVEKHLASLLDFMPKDRSKKSGLMGSQSTSRANRVFQSSLLRRGFRRNTQRSQSLISESNENKLLIYSMNLLVTQKCPSSRSGATGMSF